jgi:hypothetical protein
MENASLILFSILPLKRVPDFCHTRAGGAIDDVKNTAAVRTSQTYLKEKKVRKKEKYIFTAIETYRVK